MIRYKYDFIQKNIITTTTSINTENEDNEILVGEMKTLKAESEKGSSYVFRI